jgi:hypothetical protein
MQEYDKSSKWLIQHRGNSILRLGGVREVVEWRPLQAEFVQSRRLPDGLIEARRQGQEKPDLFLLEISAYPYARLSDQMIDDLAAVRLDRRVLPEVLTLFLHPRGNARAADSVTLHSPLRWTTWNLRWRAVKLWTIPAEDLLAADDIGLIPWVPLARFSGPPERIVSRCRVRIDQEAPLLESFEYENLLTATQVLLGLRYNKDVTLLERLRALLGGREVMIESPVYREIVEEAERKGATEARQEDILDLLVDRFGPAAMALEVELKAVEFDRLSELLKLAAKCRSLAAFRKHLAS